MTGSAIARVYVDTGLPHLDRLFDYSIPPALTDLARPGVRVKVRFAGRDLHGYLVELAEQAQHPGSLAPLRSVISPEPVLTAQVWAVAGRLAADQAGTTGDVLRLAIPPRHARAESAAGHWEEPAAPGLQTSRTAWERYGAGPAFLRHLERGGSPRAAWQAIPSAADPSLDWPEAIAEAAAATVASGRGVVVVVPDARDTDRVLEALRPRIGKDAVARLTADLGPQARYTAWLRVLRGHARVAVGNRAAALAPVRDLGLFVWWDDGDDLLREPRAPYPHVRDIGRIRSEVEGCALLTGGFARTPQVQQLVQDGGFKDVLASRELVRATAPRVQIAGSERDLQADPAAASARLPTVGWRAARQALERGPVLVQVPRRGYSPAVACTRCRTRARCAHCDGPLGIPAAHGAPACRWCARSYPSYRCPHCGGSEVRALVVGARRTAEELGRAFPQALVVTSGAGNVVASVPAEPALVIATPGAEPVASGGYAAALLLDAWALADRPSLDATSENLRRWLTAAALVRSADDGGVVVVVGAPDHAVLPQVEALIRWDPVGLAIRELAERRELRLPPEAAIAVVSGEPGAVRAVGADSALPDIVERLGPVPVDATTVRLLLRAPRAERAALATALRGIRGARSARKESDLVQIRIDPDDIDR